jgi:hypothetical protein
MSAPPTSPTCVVNPTKNALRPKCNLPPESQQARHTQPRQWCDRGDKGRKTEKMQ